MLAVGSVLTVTAAVGGEDVPVHDLGGRWVVPGLFDSHTHLVSGGFRLQQLDLSQVTSKREFVTRVSEVAASRDAAAGEWVLGGGWDETKWGGEPEINMLAQHYRVEIVVATCNVSRPLHYQSDRGWPTVYMLYTGQHYDPLVGPGPTFARHFEDKVGGPKQAAAARAAREAAALAIAMEHSEQNARRAAERSMPAGQVSPPATHASQHDWRSQFEGKPEFSAI